MQTNIKEVGATEEEQMVAFEKHVASENLAYPMERRVGGLGYAALETDCLFEGFKIAVNVLRKDLTENPEEAKAVNAEGRIKNLIDLVSAQLKVGQAALDASATRH